MLSTASALHAQTAEAPQSEPVEQGGGDIIVTALKRSTSIQETPISISAVTSESLARQNITDSNALGRVAPSLVINESSNGGSRVIIRNLYATGEPLVGLYYDEVPLSGTGGVSNDAGGTLPGLRLFDVERAEVLRGPQGTLYGASSMGGTIRIIFAKPKLDRYEGAVDGQVTTIDGSGGSLGYQMNGMVNVPIIEDKIGARVVGFYEKGAGFVDNSVLGFKDINGSESYGGRLTVRIKPIEDITLDLLGVYQNRTGARSDWNYTEYLLTNKRYDQSLLIRQPQEDELKLAAATLNWDVGFATLTATASYSERNLKYSFDYTNYFSRYQTVNQTNGLVPSYTGAPTAIPGYSRYLADCQSGYLVNTTCDGAGYQNLVNSYGIQSTYQPQSNKTNTEEIRLADDRYAFKWTVGFYHSYRKNFTRSILERSDPVTGLQNYPNGFASGDTYIVGTNFTGLDRTIDDRLEQIAGFAEATWDITDALSVTAGGRYFKYMKDTTSAVLVPSYIAGNSRQGELTASGDETGTLLKFGANYKFNRDFMLYATAAQGYRPGGVNQTLGLPSYAAVYSSDSVWAYEIGAKTSWFDRKVIVNIDAFQMDWNDMQISASFNNAFGFITNSSSPARIRGIELDTSFFPLDGLALRVSGSYIDAKLRGDQSLPSGITQCPIPFIPGTTGCATIAAGRDGDRIPYSPKWTIQGSADYTIPLEDDLQIITHADLAYRSKSLTTYDLARYATAYPNGPAGTPGGEALYTLPGFATVGLRLGLEKDEGRWGIYVFANNVFNKLGLTSLTNGQASATQLSYRYNGALIRPSFAQVTQPRVIGVQATVKFR
ncbi:TonB-dependent receptor [Sphingomonas sanxanigenens]|uniref:TonB-dependent receptor n=1 Tax=Sphingomonas sanxanigenens TaxID=397260 RepID=UPI0004B5957F|nr:TonB-dependent receptor [Sphingomonas sanxanigenens]